MAYGFLAQNDSGQTVINDTQPLYVKFRTGTLSNSGTTNYGAYKFYNSGNSIASSEEIVLFSCGVGGWITFNLALNFSYTGEMCSNQSSLSYTVFGPRSDLASPTGYGMAVFNNSGQCMWDAESTLTRITNAGVIPGSVCSGKTYSSSVVTGSNAVYCASGPAVVNFQEGYYQMSAYRSATSSWIFRQQRITTESSPFPIGDFTYTSDFSYILGTT